MKKRFIATLFVSMTLSVFAERVLVVGDSITGHSMNLSCGYTHQVRKALKDAGSKTEFIPLGGSGQSISSWRGVIHASKTKNEKLDIPNIFVKSEFDKGTDSLIVFLGMNDALAPYTDFSGLKRWKTEYQKTIDALRERVKFKKLYLASPTMLTETPYSYKNKLMDEMAKVIREVAKENGAEYIDTRETFMRFHENARKIKTGLNFARDFVHPNEFGHASLTWSFLNAIGETGAAKRYLETAMPAEMKESNQPGMSLYLQNSTSPGVVIVKGRLRGESVKNLKAIPPDGLRLEQIQSNGDEFTLTFKGNVSRLRNTLTVSSGKAKQSVALSAPFLISTGFETSRWFRASEFKKEISGTEIDSDAKAGKNVAKTLVKGQPVSWLIYYPTADVTGGADPNAVDFASVTNGNPFETGYLLRYIHSPEAAKARLNLSVPTFAGMEHLTAYWNGKEVYSDAVSVKSGKRDSVPVELKKGLNTLIVRVNHVTWQWAAGAGISDPEGKEIPNLTYSIVK